jgi:hypothetical protein
MHKFPNCDRAKTFSVTICAQLFLHDVRSFQIQSQYWFFGFLWYVDRIFLTTDSVTFGRRPELLPSSPFLLPPWNITTASATSHWLLLLLSTKMSFSIYCCCFAFLFTKTCLACHVYFLLVAMLSMIASSLHKTKQELRGSNVGNFVFWYLFQFCEK